MAIQYGHNRPPMVGGDCTKYSEPWGHKTRRLIFVNGIWNTPLDHRNACLTLSRLTNCEVTGIYNQTGVGGYASLSDGAWPTGLGVVRDLNEAFDVAQAGADWAAVGLRGLGMDKPLLNGCAASLFRVLWEEGFIWPSQPVVIVAHSQGNLITANALMHFSAQVSEQQVPWPPRIRVFAVASPALSWPTNDFISVRTYRHSMDLVAWLSIGRNATGEYQGTGEVTESSWGHEFSGYEKGSLINDICQTMGTQRGSAPQRAGSGPPLAGSGH